MLGANVENLVMYGTAVKGYGNDLGNTIYGNASANIIDGKGGADSMRGGAGDDIYVVDDLGDHCHMADRHGARFHTGRTLRFATHAGQRHRTVLFQEFGENAGPDQRLVRGSGFGVDADRRFV